MRTVKVEELSCENFKSFGFYANMINPDTEKFGSPPREFYRDIIQQNIGNTYTVSYSITKVYPRDLIINMSEYHSKTAEGLLPLDNDILIHVAPATRPNNDFPSDKIRIFYIHKGTLVVIHPGVWHHAPFVINDNPANVLIILPERTYANDCVVTQIHDGNFIQIEDNK